MVLHLEKAMFSCQVSSIVTIAEKPVKCRNSGISGWGQCNVLLRRGNAMSQLRRDQCIVTIAGEESVLLV